MFNISYLIIKDYPHPSLSKDKDPFFKFQRDIHVAYSVQ